MNFEKQQCSEIASDSDKFKAPSLQEKPFAGTLLHPQEVFELVAYLPDKNSSPVG
jgi:hypothetical protein